jgi:hypothetical protein
MKIDSSEFANAELANDIVPYGALAFAAKEAQARLFRSVASLHERLKPLLEELHGIPIALWMRMAQDEYGRTGKIEFAHIARSLSVRSRTKEPYWATDALPEPLDAICAEEHNKESDAICEAVLSFQLDGRPGRVSAVHRAVRDFRLTCQIFKVEKGKNLSRKNSFKAVTKLLPAKAHGQWFSEQTPKRAWRRYCSERSYRRLYK